MFAQIIIAQISKKINDKARNLWFSGHKNRKSSFSSQTGNLTAISLVWYDKPIISPWAGKRTNTI